MLENLPPLESLTQQSNNHTPDRTIGHETAVLEPSATLLPQDSLPLSSSPSIITYASEAVSTCPSITKLECSSLTVSPSTADLIQCVKTPTFAETKTEPAPTAAAPTNDDPSPTTTTGSADVSTVTAATEHETREAGSVASSVARRRPAKELFQRFFRRLTSKMGHITDGSVAAVGSPRVPPTKRHSVPVSPTSESASSRHDGVTSSIRYEATSGEMGGISGDRKRNSLSKMFLSQTSEAPVGPVNVASSGSGELINKVKAGWSPFSTLTGQSLTAQKTSGLLSFGGDAAVILPDRNLRLSFPEDPATKDLSKLTRYKISKIESGCLLYMGCRPAAVPRMNDLSSPLSTSSAATSSPYSTRPNSNGSVTTSSDLTVIFELEGVLSVTIMDYYPIDQLSMDLNGRSSGEFECTVLFRPFVLPLLRSLKTLGCRVGVCYSWASRALGDRILDELDPNGTLIDMRLYRSQNQHHSSTNGGLGSWHRHICRENSGDNGGGWDVKRCVYVNLRSAESSSSSSSGSSSRLVGGGGMAGCECGHWQVVSYENRLVFGQLSGLMSTSSTNRSKRYAKPVLLCHNNSAGLTSIDRQQLFVGCGSRDFALLNLYAWIKVLMRCRTTTARAFTEKHKAELEKALISGASDLVVPRGVSSS